MTFSCMSSRVKSNKSGDRHGQVHPANLAGFPELNLLSRGGRRWPGTLAAPPGAARTRIRSGTRPLAAANLCTHLVVCRTRRNAGASHSVAAPCCHPAVTAASARHMMCQGVGPLVAARASRNLHKLSPARRKGYISTAAYGPGDARSVCAASLLHS